MMFAAALVPLSIAVGAAVDLRRQANAKAEIQDAADAAVLAGARAYYAAAGEPEGQRLKAAKAAADNYMMTAKALSGLDTLSWKLKLTGKPKQLVLTGGGATPTMFGGMVGKSKLNFKFDTAAMAGNGRKLEIALVLDNTGSMLQGDKIGKLRVAATELVGKLEAASKGGGDPEGVKVALVPFSQTVNVGPQYRNASWMSGKWHTPSEDLFSVAGQNRFALLDAMKVSWAGCVESRAHPHDVLDTAPTSSKPETMFTPYFAPDEPGDVPQDEAGTRAMFAALGGLAVNDYLPDDVTGVWNFRQKNVGKYDEAPRQSYLNREGGLPYGPNANCGITPLQRLTNDFAAVQTTVANMKADGYTNIPMGLVWGWHALSPSGPFKDGAPYDAEDVTKIVILMTDGENHNDPLSNPNNSLYSGIGYIWQNRVGVTGGTKETRRAAMDARLKTLCANMQAKKIVLYTVRVEVETGDDPVLKGCASSEDKYFDVQNASGLVAAFDKIAESVAGLRLTR